MRLPGMAAAPQQAAGAPSSQEITAALHRGGALFAAKRFGDAGDVARLILRFEPKHPDALHLLGLVTLAEGKPADAERLMLQALKRSGPHPVLLVNLGNAARGQEKTEKALRYYDQAIALKAQHEDAWIERGILLTSLVRYGEAAEAFERAIALNPANVAAYSGAAHVASEMGLFRKAIAYCESGMAQTSTPPIEMPSMIAVSYERLSELDAAIEAAEKVLAVNPDHATCLRVLTKAQRRQNKGNRDVLLGLKARLEGVHISSLSNDDASVVYSELAHICDELGETETAYVYFGKLNETRRSVIVERNLDDTLYLQHVETLHAEMTPEVLARVRANAASLPVERGGRTPVFIIGFPRSGTTLLDQILDAHPDVQVIEEQPLVNALRRAVEALPGGFTKALQTMREPQRKKLQELYWRELGKHGGDFSKKVIIDKMPLSIVHAVVIAAVFPDAKIILALRHPADSCLSCFMQDFELNGAMLNFTDMARTVRLYDLVMGLWQRYEGHLELDVCEVRYENLVTDLRAEVIPVLDFLGLDWDEAVSDPAAHALARGTIRTPSYAQVTQPIYASATDRWRRYAPYIADELPVLEKHITYFGYAD